MGRFSAVEMCVDLVLRGQAIEHLSVTGAGKSVFVSQVHMASICYILRYLSSSTSNYMMGFVVA
jgi:hypothetical protein